MEGIDELGVSLPTLIAQVINFGILFLLLYLVAYRPIMRMFDERSKKIKDSVDQAEYIKEQVARTEEEAEKRIETASKEGQELVARAVKTGEEVRQKAEVGAKAEAEVLIQRARSDIQRERDEAIDDVRKAFADLMVQAAEKVIDRSLDKEAHREIIEKVLEESITFKKK
ncbi:MAG: F0F1 ATP synthase subunit B [Chloroflexi bacterium]|nr:F0F1 ATP synthase subunit B [Chloroflexota bacterium]